MGGWLVGLLRGGGTSGRRPREVSGTTVPFGDPVQGLSGSVTSVRTFRNTDGSFCRA